MIGSRSRLELPAHLPVCVVKYVELGKYVKTTAVDICVPTSKTDDITWVIWSLCNFISVWYPTLSLFGEEDSTLLNVISDRRYPLPVSESEIKVARSGLEPGPPQAKTEELNYYPVLLLAIVRWLDKASTDKVACGFSQHLITASSSFRWWQRKRAKSKTNTAPGRLSR